MGEKDGERRMGREGMVKGNDRETRESWDGDYWMDEWGVDEKKTTL